MTERKPLETFVVGGGWWRCICMALFWMHPTWKIMCMCTLYFWSAGSCAAPLHSGLPPARRFSRAGTRANQRPKSKKEACERRRVHKRRSHADFTRHVPNEDLRVTNPSKVDNSCLLLYRKLGEVPSLPLLLFFRGDTFLRKRHYLSV